VTTTSSSTLADARVPMPRRFIISFSVEGLSCSSVDRRIRSDRFARATYLTFFDSSTTDHLDRLSVDTLHFLNRSFGRYYVLA
jgi:hypothetical protein